jgi:hypothetical protein
VRRRPDRFTPTELTMWLLRIILIALSALAWFQLLHAQVTLPAIVVLGLIGLAVLMSVIAVVQWRRRRIGEEVIRMAGTGIFDGDPKYERLKQLREDEGYTGPVDQDGNKAD